MEKKFGDTQKHTWYLKEPAQSSKSPPGSSESEFLILKSAHSIEKGT